MPKAITLLNGRTVYGEIIPVQTAASVATPPAGSVVLFFDSSNGNRLSQKDSAGAVIDLAASGGGGVAASTRILLIEPAKFGAVTITSSDNSALTTSNVMCWLAPNDEYDADDLDDISVVGVATTGAIDFTLNSNGPIVGLFNVNYILG